MPIWIKDSTRRFKLRPLFKESEIEEEARSSLKKLCSRLAIEVSYPLSDDALVLLIESLTDEFDQYADMTEIDGEVDGFTEFSPHKLPNVYVNADLTMNGNRNRKRMTVAHEAGHVVLHRGLYSQDQRQLDLINIEENIPIYCRQNEILNGVDWREWQASFFAGSLLMPKQLLSDLIDASYRSHPPIDGSAEAIALRNLVASHFDVSRDAARVRLVQARMVRPSGQTHFLDAASRS